MSAESFSQEERGFVCSFAAWLQIRAYISLFTVGRGITGCEATFVEQFQNAKFVRSELEDPLQTHPLGGCIDAHFASMSRAFFSRSLLSRVCCESAPRSTNCAWQTSQSNALEGRWDLLFVFLITCLAMGFVFFPPLAVRPFKTTRPLTAFSHLCQFWKMSARPSCVSSTLAQELRKEMPSSKDFHVISIAFKCMILMWIRAPSLVLKCFR